MVSGACGLALIAVIAASFEDIIFRYGMREDACPWAVLFFYHAAAVVICLPLAWRCNVSELSGTQWLLLIASSALWLVGDLYGCKALKYLDATVCGIISSSKLVLAAAAGVVLFSEHLSWAALFGMVLIILSTLNQIDRKALKFNRGVVYEGIAVIFIAGALIVDKYLAGSADESIIVFFGFLLPIFLYGSFGYKRLPQILPSLRKSNYLFLLAPVLGTVSYYAMIAALKVGALSVTYTIQHTGIIFIFVLELAFFGVVPDLRKRAVSCVICAVGSLIVCGFV